MAGRPRRWVEASLWPGEIQHRQIRALPHPFENNFTTIRRDVEVANVEVGSEVGQLPLGARLQVDEPEVFMLYLSSQEHERSSSMQEGKVSSPASQGQGRKGMRCGFGRNGLRGKRGADVGS